MSPTELASRYEQVRETLESHNQQHVLTFYEELDDAGKAALLDQIDAQDWAALADLVQQYVVREPDIKLPASIEPAPYYPAEPTAELKTKYDEARALGEQMIRDGKVAAFTVAGGQGTRLGWDGPKGTFPASPIENKTLFQLFAESIIKVRTKYDADVRWYIMTSPINDAPTRAFFAEHDNFGLPAEAVTFFPQGTVPSFSTDGGALLADKGTLATNPDGHGGSLLALFKSGAIDDMASRGVEQISYFQVDNPLVRCVDPLFIGLHALDGAEMSSKMVQKANAAEKVGVFADVDGKISVIEYSDLPDELANATNADGSLKFNGGSIAIHVIALNFVRKLNAGAFGLPWHRAIKKVPHVDLATGAAVEPGAPNAVKLETFVFDALPLCEKSIVLETIRADEFGPIKNAEGSDSAATSKALQTDRAARWLESRGCRVARDASGNVEAAIEISPLTAVEPTDLDNDSVPQRVNPGERVSL
ncbi:MAG: UDPGP type 1 family protein [Phycisphaera sp.]|nr:UDPGP type 1 family protein [Phycisphaera sp.]